MQCVFQLSLALLSTSRYFARGTTDCLFVVGVMNIVCYLDGGGFGGVSQYLTFARVEFHFIIHLPSVDGVEVTLEGCRVMYRRLSNF